jgi:hypothetical protein
MGIEVTDVIVQVNGRPIRSMYDLRNAGVLGRVHASAGSGQPNQQLHVAQRQPV